MTDPTPQPAEAQTGCERARGLILAAPASGSGKTLTTLGLLRAWRRAGVRVGSFKVGPDFIDPAFHEAATGRPSWNVDGWAMRAETLRACVAATALGAERVLGEGMMGLFDGAPDGRGSTAHVSAALGLPVLLVVDASAQAASAAALVHGFATFRSDTHVAGVLFNRVASSRHATLLRRACEPLGIPVVGCIEHAADLHLPERHLGLVQAAEHPSLHAFLERAADHMERGIDLTALDALCAPLIAVETPLACMPPLGERIAVARDPAFSFVYPSILASWRNAGSVVRCFSPLAGEAPAPECDAVYLPGGYPELFAERLAAHSAWQRGLRERAAAGACIYGECGGYMALGRTLRDAAGKPHAMAGLLPLETSFQQRRLQLGYRGAALRVATPFAAAGSAWSAHEFHHATVVSEESGDALFDATDAEGHELGGCGMWRGRVGGSFLHLIDSREGLHSSA